MPAQRRLTPITLTVTVLGVVIILAGGFLFFGGSRIAPAALSAAAEAAPQIAAPGATPDGQWTLAADGEAFVGYRVREELASLAAPSDAVGRSTAVTGGMMISGTTIQQVQVTADLRQLASDSGTRDEAIRSAGLESDTFPEATFALTQPLDLNGTPTVGQLVEGTANGQLTVHGVTRPVTLTLQARWDGDAIQVAGSTPVLLSEFGIKPPVLGPVVSINDQATAEFQVTFRRA